MENMRKIIGLVFLSVFCCAAISYGEDGISSSFLKLGISAQQLALGNAYTGISNDISAMFYNPAGLGKLNNPELGFTHVNLFENTGYNFIGFADSSLKDNLYYGVGVVQLIMGDIQKRDNNNSPNGSFSYKNEIISISLAKKASDEVSLGLTYKNISKSLDNTNTSVSELDLGILYNVSDRFGLGLTVQNLLQTKFVRGSGISDVIPLNIRFGTGLKFIDMKNYNMILVADAEKNDSTDKPVMHGGIEMNFANMLAVRAGIYNNKLTAGFGITLNNIKIDYALLSNDELGESQRITAKMMFGNKVKVVEPEPETAPLPESVLETVSKTIPEQVISTDTIDQVISSSATIDNSSVAVISKFVVLDFLPVNISTEQAKTISGLLRGLLKATTEIRSLDEQQMKLFIGNMDFLLTGCYDKQCVIQVGKLFDVDKIVTGSIELNDNVYLVGVEVVDVQTGATDFSDKYTCYTMGAVDSVIESVVKIITARFSK
jgi:hypothetical protein